MDSDLKLFPVRTFLLASYRGQCFVVGELRTARRRDLPPCQASSLPAMHSAQLMLQSLM